MSIAKEAQKSVSPVEWEMTCSRKPITCSVYFALAKKLLYLCKRDCGLASGDLAALPCWQFAVDLLARWLLQPVPPSRRQALVDAAAAVGQVPTDAQQAPWTGSTDLWSKSQPPFPRRDTFHFFRLGCRSGFVE